MKIPSITIALTTCLLLTACGGGGGGSTPAVALEPAAPAAPSTPDPTPSGSTEEITATEQLSAAATFDLRTSSAISVDIDISALGTSQGYLSICSALADAAPDYDNCFVRTALPDQRYEGTLDISTAQQVAYSAIWFLDESRDAVITRHDLAQSNIELTL